MGYNVYSCSKCGTEMIRQFRVIKPWGHRKRITDLYCPQCKKFTRNSIPVMITINFNRRNEKDGAS